MTNRPLGSRFAALLAVPLALVIARGASADDGREQTERGLACRQADGTWVSI